MPGRKFISFFIFTYVLINMKWISISTASEPDCIVLKNDPIFKDTKPLKKGLLSMSGFGYALLVGIDNYNSCPMILPDLTAPVCEIKKLAAVLAKNQYVIKTLLDQEATSQNIHKWLLCLAEKTNVDDRILFYFAGHGGNLTDLALKMDDATRTRYWDQIVAGLKSNQGQFETDEFLLCTYQTKMNALRDVMFMNELTQWISKSRAHQQIVWIDACYSGNMNQIFQIPLKTYTYRLLNDGFFAVTGIKAKVQDGKYGKAMLSGLLGEADKLFAGNRDNIITLHEITIYIDNLLRPEIQDSSGILYKSRYIQVGSGEINLITIP